MRTAHPASASCLALFFLAAVSGGSIAAPDGTSGPTRTSTRANPEITVAPPLPQKKPSPSFAQLQARLDGDDRLIAMRALHLALTQVPDGGTFVWRKNSRSLKGLIKPTKAFRNADGQVCRRLIYALSLGRYLKQIEGVACREQNGSWHL